MDDDLGAALRDTVRSAFEHRTRLCIQGGGSKHFYGRAPHGEILDTSGHRGIVSYAPTELILTARSGTPLTFIEKTLSENGQMLPFEPPRLGSSATLGGMVACGLAGPRRPYSGAVRDYLLGVRCITGEGKALRFGGEVVKNVAGFDAFRLMAGAMGTLGVLLEVTFKVLPQPRHEITLVYDRDAATAISDMNRWAAQPLPLSGTAFDGEHLYVRLEGSETAIAAARRTLGGEVDPDGPAFWAAVREQHHPFFRDPGLLWRISVPPSTRPLPIVGRWFLEWGGAQRWLRTVLSPQVVREMAARAGGHASLFRGGDRQGNVFHPLSPALLDIHRNLKQAFDPRGILNHQRMYKEY